jgi:hypothetical protein
MDAHDPRIPRPTASPTWRRLNQLTSYALVLAVDAQAVRLLLLDQRASGTVTLRRARCWPAPAPPGAVLAAVGAAYRNHSTRAPTSVHLAHNGTAGPWPGLLRRAVGPLAEVTDHAPAEVGWSGAARLGLAVLGIDPDQDPEHAAILAEHAITRTTTPEGTDRG